MNQFKVGDKVKYKESEKYQAFINGHQADTIYIVRHLNDDDNDSVYFEGSPNRCSTHRLEPAFSNRHKHAELMIAYANDTTLKFQYRSNPDEEWSDLSQPNWYPDFEYRIKPKTVTKYQVLYLMTEYNQANVTSDYFFDEEDFNSAGYIKAKFISMIKETAKEFQT